MAFFAYNQSTELIICCANWLGSLGQPLLMTDHLHNVVWQAELSPYGTALPTVSLNDPGLRFPGQWDEAETVLLQNWHRDYDPTLGRYIEADPLGLAAGQSMYGYAESDPINSTDPLGLCPFCPSPTDVALGRAALSQNRDAYLSGLADGFGEAFGFGGDDKKSSICSNNSVFADFIGIRQGNKIAQTLMGATGPAIGLRNIGASAAAQSPKYLNRVNHVFGSKNLNKHNLGPLLKKYGGNRNRAYDALRRRTQNLADRGRINGRFETRVRVRGQDVTVRGRLSDSNGTVDVSTAFVR